MPNSERKRGLDVFSDFSDRELEEGFDLAEQSYNLTHETMARMKASSSLEPGGLHRTLNSIARERRMFWQAIRRRNRRNGCTDMDLFDRMFHKQFTVHDNPLTLPTIHRHGLIHRNLPQEFHSREDIMTDPFTTSYEEIETTLKNLPLTWIPALLATLVQEAERKNVFVKGGIERFTENARKNARERKELSLPTIHLNGTSKEHLLEAISTAHSAVLDSERALAETSPNYRDYYLQGWVALKQVEEEYRSRMERLRSVRLELEQLAEGIVDQGRQKV